jgi:hypothetical protein
LEGGWLGGLGAGGFEGGHAEFECLEAVGEVGGRGRGEGGVERGHAAFEFGEARVEVGLGEGRELEKQE